MLRQFINLNHKCKQKSSAHYLYLNLNLTNKQNQKSDFFNDYPLYFSKALIPAPYTFAKDFLRVIPFQSTFS